ncbi:class I SAM-dependent methyltransferase [Paucibacter sp. DJ1R-11]|uniref:class I SAM-dependent methyltransferase n=1 Tax=Paucibacter sp. DJ1R-11 TaxID=2893556 RepID=UPI0021E3B3D9|nr:class I SAM-dependent methyltransferase [Paucibacter sp. DJ1R-11]MCV2363462.1 class I SAM-dependent methyltransferase [Paucibacter sp. DJ1R-11]
MSRFANEAAYDLWAESYPPLPHNPLMRAEQSAVLSLLPEVNGRRVLDLACGSGRYGLWLQPRGASLIVGTDLSSGMLARAPLAHRVRADMGRLPFSAASFDVIVSGLAVGHAPSLSAWMAEAARVLAPGGHLVYSDFHPAAARAGMTRSFTDAAGERHELLHAVYELDAHQAAAEQAGLVLEASREVCVGRELCEPFTGSAVFYSRWSGLPVVLALRLRKP